MMPARTELPIPSERSLRQWIRKWSRVWRLPGLPSRIQIEFSSRLRVSLARTLLRRGVVRLSTDLLLPENVYLIPEVLCHETAHIAVRELGSTRARPHGPEWADLVRRAGFTPHTRQAVPRDESQASTRDSGRVVYEHRCLVCHFSRSAAKPMARWRCATCVACGLSGELAISSRFLLPGKV